MKAPHLITFSLAAAASLLGVGCASSADTSHTNRNRGAVGGAAAGAVLGGLIGANSSKVSTEGGAAIGAVAGGIAGGAIGNAQDRRNENRGYNAPVYSSADTGYSVRTVPLAPVSEPQETMTPQPSRDAVWIRGHYVWTGNAYQWQPGRWEVPPSGSRVWVPPSWQPTNGGYVYTRGHWQ